MRHDLINTNPNPPELDRREFLVASILAAGTFAAAVQPIAAQTVIKTDDKGLITSFNKSAEHLLGYRAAEMIGKKTPALIHDPQEVITRAHQFSQQLHIPLEPGFEVFVAKTRLGMHNEHEWLYVRKDGSKFPVTLSVTGLYDEQQHIIGFIGFNNIFCGPPYQ